MRIYVIESKYETLKTNWKRVKHVNIIESKQISCTSMFYISIAEEETQSINSTRVLKIACGHHNQINEFAEKRRKLTFIGRAHKNTRDKGQTNTK